MNKQKDESLFTIAKITYVDKVHTIIGQCNSGPFKYDYFKVTITQSPKSDVFHENNESAIVVSDNNGGDYKIAIRYGDVDYNDNLIRNYSPIHYQDDFDCTEYDIPHYVWCIVTGMIIAVV